MNNQPKKEICKNLGSSSDRVAVSHVIYVKKNGQRYRKFFFPKCCARHLVQLVIRMFNGPIDPFFQPIFLYFADFLQRYLESEQNDDWSDEELTYIHEGESSDEVEMKKKEPEKDTIKKSEEKTGKINEKAKKVKETIFLSERKVPEETAEKVAISNADEDLYEDDMLYYLYESQAQIAEDNLQKKKPGNKEAYFMQFDISFYCHAKKN
ncbi:uncharacterized protein [Drosophila takahashii]|uniref:uncharacterized protein n=1 Tax=Drosophila takahashii TaxID=29030 RepID=UPI0038993952